MLTFVTLLVSKKLHRRDRSITCNARLAVSLQHGTSARRNRPDLCAGGPPVMYGFYYHFNNLCFNTLHKTHQ